MKRINIIITTLLFVFLCVAVTLCSGQYRESEDRFCGDKYSSRRQAGS